MRILVLTKPVPDPAAGAERLGPGLPARPRRLADGRQRQRRVRARGGPPARRGARRRGRDPLDGAGQRAPRRCARRSRWARASGVLVTDPALEGSDVATTIRVLAAAAAGGSSTSCSPALDTSDGRRRRGRGRRCRPAGPAAALDAARDRARSGGRPGARPAASARRATTSSRRRCRRVISCTQALGAPRYPSLKGIMAARSREIAMRSLADLDAPAGRRPAAAGRHGWSAAEPPPARAAGRVVRGAAETPPARSPTSSPTGGSSDGAAHRRRRRGRPTGTLDPALDRGRHARPIAGRGVGRHRRRARGGRGAGRRRRGARRVPAAGRRGRERGGRAARSGRRTPSAEVGRLIDEGATHVLLGAPTGRPRPCRRVVGAAGLGAARERDRRDLGRRRPGRRGERPGREGDHDGAPSRAPPASSPSARTR